MSGKLQKRPFTNLSVPFEGDRQPVLGDSWRDLTAHFERTSIHWERKVTHLRATYALLIYDQQNIGLRRLHQVFVVPILNGGYSR